MAKKSKPALLSVDDIASSSSDEALKTKKQVISDSEESYEEFGEDEINEDVFAAEGGVDELSVSDIDVSSSDEDIQMIKKRLERK